MDDDVLLTAKKVRQRFGDISDMSLWRWINDQKVAFPQPIYINTVRYWKLSELVAWENARPRHRVAA
ncbi:MAG: transcriptional regulator [Mesorhizobium sp.]|uniref:helix-turn-helix transcriptional regulator n=1 Tax=Mesorhizobium sp. TaxID=1871066 RepID=UPI000FE6E526|nr:DNA-binding protein [Mesorhizobium sp.]RWC53850.1 MAG: transcriptional regulator [Mesorhizobium sp.]TIV83164.1 MAG: transcriptional regulator [Mesorhizobium sp.]TIW47682.1 MAG: transcriptional regulator [Mesorhizobium sp.]TIX16664.1 MAG: transcriptional regulator [Mesorhizobium sp.]TIX68438.1 MAG: transcriptional regulator [Mesorhizobium sp.]